MENQVLDTIDNGVIENVHIAPIGDFNGSDSKGNPVPEHITKEALEQLADRLNAGDDVLMDIDHKSAKPGVDKDTSAVGWFHKFIVDPIKGLFATLKLTAKGREIFQNREYRYTSPTFLLNDNGEPVDLHSVAATNLPAFKGYISPILNSESTEISSTQEEKITMEITKEELVSLIKETVASMKDEVKNEQLPENTEEIKKVEETAEKQETKEEVKNEEVPEKTEGEKLAEELKKETDEVKNEEVPEKKEETKEEVKEETKEEKKEEVIKEEALNQEPKKEVVDEQVLNSQPTPTLGNLEPEWKSLNGKDFWSWLSKHPEAK